MPRKPAKFKHIDIEINDAYGDLRTHISNRYGVKLPSSIDVYVFDYIYRIMEPYLSEEAKKNEVGDILTHDSIRIQPIIIKLMNDGLKSGSLARIDMLHEMRDYKRFEINTNQIIFNAGNRANNTELIAKIHRDGIGL